MYKKILITLIFVSLVIPIVCATDWPMLHRNANRTSYTPDEGPVTNHTRWTIPYSGSATSVVVAEDALYFGISNFGSSAIYAYNATNGTQIWNTTLGWAPYSPAISVEHNLVYIGTDNNRLYAINATNGTGVWNYLTGNDVKGIPLIANDIVYFGSDDDIFYALNATNGTSIWNYTTGSNVRQGAAIANGTVYFGSGVNVYALYANNGTYIRNYTTSGGISYYATLVVNGTNTLYVTTGDARIFAFYISNGTQKWNYTTGGGAIVSGPTYANDRIYSGDINAGNRVRAINATNGTQIWTYSTDGYVYTSSAISGNDIVYGGSYNKNVHALNATNGTEIWVYGTGALVGSVAPAIVDGIMYIPVGGKVYSFGPDYIFSTTEQFNNGSSTNITTDTNRYNQSSGALELDFPQASKDPNLVGYWRFESNPNDETNSYNGTVNGGVTNVTGFFDNAYYFDGSTGYVDIGDIGVTSGENWTVAFWSNSSNFVLPSYPIGIGGAYGIFVPFTSDRWGLYVQATLLYGSVIQENVWYFFTVVKNNTDYTLYINGSYDINGSRTQQAINDLNIGIRADGNWYFNGTIDEVKIYNRTLDGAEVAEIYNSREKYKTSGNWLSPIITINNTHILSNTTIQFSNVDSGKYIDKVEWYINGTLRETNDTDITSGISVTYTNDTESGFFNLTNGNLTIKVYLIGSGASTPIIEKIYGFFIIGDVTPPNVTINNPITNGNHSGDMNVNTTIRDDIDVNNASVYYWIENGSGNQTDWTNLYNISSGDRFYYNATFNTSTLSDGLYNVTINASDTVGNVNATEKIEFRIDNSGPNFITMYHDPNATDDVDPDVNITVIANITDVIGLDTVIFQYKRDGLATWNNVTMQNGTPAFDTYNATFNVSTPADTWNYRVWTNDSIGNENTSIQVNITVDYDKSWQIIPATFGTKSGVLNTNITVGNLTINNTADYGLHFDLSSAWPDIFYNDTSSFDLAIGNNKTLWVNVTTQGFEWEDQINITATCTTSGCSPSSNASNFTLVSYAGGPYLSITVSSIPSSVNQSQSNIALSIYVKNIGNETANNITFNYSFPDSGWTNSTNATDITNETLGVNSISWHSIIAQTSSDAYAGTKNIILSASCDQCTENSSDTETQQVIVLCNGGDGTCGAGCSSATDTDCSSGNGGSTGGGGGGGGAPSSSVILSSEIIELVRGRDNEFILGIINNKKGVLDNVTATPAGYLSQYILVTPHMLNNIAYNETKNFTIKITAPTYIERGVYELNFTINGNISEQTIKRSYKEIRTVTLFIYEISPEESSASLSEAERGIASMIEAGFPIRKVSVLLEMARAEFEKRNYEEVKEIGDQIAQTISIAFDTYALMQELGIQLGEAEAQGLDVSQSRELLDLALASFEREAFDLAQQRAEQAQSVLSIETKGEFNIWAFVLSYWWAIITVAVIAAVSGAVIRKRTILKRIDDRLAELMNEEININKLLEETQVDFFQKKAITDADYYSAMAEYKKRLVEIKTEMTKLRAKRSGILTLGKELDVLREEYDSITKMIKQSQSDFYKKQSLKRGDYLAKVEEYKIRRIEIEETIAVIEGKIEKQALIEQRSGKNKVYKIKKGFLKLIRKIRSIF